MPRIIKITKPAGEDPVVKEKISGGELLFTAMEKYSYETAAYTDGKLKKTIMALDKFKNAVGKDEYADPYIVDCRLHEFISASIPETVNNPYRILRLVSKSGRTYELVNITMQKHVGEVTLNCIIARKDPLESTISFWENNEWVPKIRGTLAQKIMRYSMINENIEEAFFFMLYPFDPAHITKIEAFIELLDDREKKNDVLRICHLNSIIDQAGMCLFEPPIGFFIIPRCPNLMGSAIRSRNGNYEQLWYINEKQLRSALKENCRPVNFSYSAIKEPVVIDVKEIRDKANYLVGSFNGKYPVIRTLLANKKEVSIPFMTKTDLEDDKIVAFMKHPPFSFLKYDDQDIADMLLRFTHVKQWLKNTTTHL